MNIRHGLKMGTTKWNGGPQFTFSRSSLCRKRLQPLSLQGKDDGDRRFDWTEAASDVRLLLFHAPT